MSYNSLQETTSTDVPWWRPGPHISDATRALLTGYAGLPAEDVDRHVVECVSRGLCTEKTKRRADAPLRSARKPGRSARSPASGCGRS